ncbi:MAG: hypothetical protein GX557_01960 [Chloroflexi bacterium]|nr:hypothetical protein [Chloroflexota bacterium]
MTEFPRTTVGGVSLSRMIVGTNWFLGYSHTSAAKDKFIREYQTRERLADTISVFLRHGIDAIMGMPVQMLSDAISDAQDRVGRKMTLILTPNFNVRPGGPADNEPEPVFDRCKALGATFCFPHTSVTDVLIDKRAREIRDLPTFTRMIRERGMIPGLSTHEPESVIFADERDYDVASYIQIFNAAGFLMHVEIDWCMRVIHNAKKPVMTIKPMAAGRLLPAVGLLFSWNAIREQDLVTVGTTTPEEAQEVIELSLDFISRRQPDNELQFTRSKRTLVSK